MEEEEEEPAWRLFESSSDDAGAGSEDSGFLAQELFSR